MSTTLGDSRLNENSKWTPEEDAILIEAVNACESFVGPFIESHRFTRARPSRSQTLLEYHRSESSGKDEQVLQEALDSLPGPIPPKRYVIFDYVSV